MKTLFSLLVKAVAAVFGLALMASLMLVGLTAALGLLVWAKLRGRPVVAPRFTWVRTGAFSAAGARAPQADVVDIDAREVAEHVTALPAGDRSGR